MSDFLSVAAVTLTLQKMLDARSEAFRLAAGLDPGTVSITAKTPARAQESFTSGQYGLNLFMYQTELNAAWRNMDLPPARSGESGMPPLALNLHFLLSAYGPTDEIEVQKILGFGMSVLHDYAVLTPKTLATYAGFSDLHTQVERIRITPLSMSLEDLSKLWTVFQASFRPSALYQVSVVLLESARPRVAPLPVLSIGPGNRGVLSQTALTPPYATLTAVTPAHNQPAAVLKDLETTEANRMTLAGHHLSGDGIQVRIRNPHVPDTLLPCSLVTGNATQLTVALGPVAASDPWPPGLYTVEVKVTLPGSSQLSNTLPFGVAPQITDLEAVTATEGWTVTVTSSLKIHPDQSVVLLLDGYEFRSRVSGATPSNTVVFAVTDLPGGTTWRVRLRVDGVESQLVDRTVSPPAFRVDANEKFTLELP